MTNQEFDQYCQEGNNALSDLDFAYNSETGEFDLPTIEWDGMYGKSREVFDNAEEQSKALEEYNKNLKKWVVEYRRKEYEEKQAAMAEKKRIEKMKTVGEQNPVLKGLLLQMLGEQYG